MRSIRSSGLTLLAIAFLGAVAAIAFLAVAAPNLPPESNSAELIPAPTAAPAASMTQPHYVGVGSCAARACHGSPTLSPGKEWNSAFAIWIARDPHAHAYKVLTTPESQQMAVKLGLSNPTAAARCLACHSTPVNDDNVMARADNAASMRTDGVSCEACHGPAEHYLAAHTWRDWKAFVEKRFQPQFGMLNTEDIAARAQLCVGCHVGEPDATGRPWRDVNHDLIAAGHPRLNFEFSAYMCTLPPHWNKKRDSQRFDELRSWIVGQWTTADAALRLLKTRAQSASQSEITTNITEPKLIIPPSWPELAEYNCFACHHGLSGQNRREDVNNAALAKTHPALDPQRAAAIARPTRKSGTPAWGTWYFEGPRIMAGAAAVLPETQAIQWVEALNTLTTTMQTPYPRPAQVDPQATQCRSKLKDCKQSLFALLPADSQSREASTLRHAIVQSIANRVQSQKPESWDEFVQLYLALVAFHRSSMDLDGVGASATTDRHQQIARILEEIRNRLRFPTDSTKVTGTPPSPELRVLRSGINSPEQFDPSAKQPALSSKEFGGKDMFELFEEACRLLSAP